MTEEVSSTTNELFSSQLARQMNLIEDESEIMTGAMEEVGEVQAGPLSLFKDTGFDPVTSEQHHMMLHNLYQPLELEDGRYTCKICHQDSPSSCPIFVNKNQFASHRYRCHGTFMNLLQCPDTDCDLQFSSIIGLKKHLQISRSLPIESHFKHFVNVSEFEIWRTTVEQVTGSRFVLHNRQAPSKRNVMHCFRSEHKIPSSAKNRNRQCRMSKAGSVCPAHITFVENHTGSVDVVYQLFHFGHDLEEIRQYIGPSREDFFAQREESLSINTIFPVTNRLPKSAAMQYVQLCLVDLPDALYLSTRYSQLLVVLDVQSYFIFAKPIPNPRFVSEQVHKSHLVRQLVETFTQFGCPVGFSVCGASAVLFDSMECIEEVFNVSMTHVGNVTPDLSFLKKSVLDRAIDELGMEDRWPEVVPFVVYAHNSEGGGDKYLSPFEMMFNRRPPHSQDAQELMEDAQRTQNEAMVEQRFHEGDYVLVRYFDSEIIAEGPIPNASQPQPSTEYLNGVVGEVDWYGSPFYPYKVFICRSTEEPNTDCSFIWVSPFDVAPTVGDLRNSRNIQRRSVAAQFNCVCGDESRGERCMLARSELCAHRMSRVCCEKSERDCEYHSEYNSGEGDSYKRVEGLARRFNVKDKYNKGEEMRREEEENIKKERTLIIDETEDEERIEVDGIMEEGRREMIITTPIPSKITPSPHNRVVNIRGRRDEEEQHPSSSQPVITTVHRVHIAEKKPSTRGVKRREEEINEDGESGEKFSPTPKRMNSCSSVANRREESSGPMEEPTGDRRKSGRVSKPNTLFKSFANH